MWALTNYAAIGVVYVELRRGAVGFCHLPLAATPSPAAATTNSRRTGALPKHAGQRVGANGLLESPGAVFAVQDQLRCIKCDLHRSLQGAYVDRSVEVGR